MQLTKAQDNLLRRYQSLHGHSPTVLELTWSGRLRWLPLIAGMGAGLLIAALFPSPAHLAGYFMMGMCFGAFLRDIGHNRISVQLWPLMEQIVDWRRVEELVRNSAESDAQQPPHLSRLDG